MSKQQTLSRVSYLFEGVEAPNGATRHPGTPYDLRAALTVGTPKNAAAREGKSGIAFKAEGESIEELLSWTMKSANS